MAANTAQLAAQGLPAQNMSGITAWLKKNGLSLKGGGARNVDPLNNDYFGTGGANWKGGGATTSMGDGNGAGYLGASWTSLPGFEQFYTGAVQNGDSSEDARINKDALAAYLKQNGYSIQEADVSGNGMSWARWVQDKNGNIIGRPTAVQNTSASDLRNIALIGGAALGGAYLSGGFTGGGLGTVGSSIGEVGMLGGTEGLAGLSSALPEGFAGLGGAAGAGAGAGAAGSGSLLSTITKAAGKMGFSDWLNLFNTGAGLYMSNKGQNQAADLASQSAGLSKEWLDFAKQQWTANQPYVQASQQAQTDLTKQLIATMGKQNDLADEYAQYNRETFRPLEQKIVADAQGYDTPERRQAAAEAAMSDVNTNLGALQQARARRLAAEGINPGSTRAMAALDGQNVDQALALTSAARQARMGVEATGFARQMDAASLGRNLPSAQATAAATGVNAAGAASGAATAGANAALPTNQYLGQAYQGSGSLMNTAAGIINNANAQSNDLWMNLGSSIGRTSDRNVKTDVEPEDEGTPEEALAEVEATPVPNWKYDPAAMAARGLEIPPGEEGENTGPMAQDAQATMGDSVAPGGKEINLGNMLGKTMLAVKAVSKEVKELQGTVAQLLQSGQLQVGAAA